MLFTRMVSSLSIRENNRLSAVREQAVQTCSGREGVAVSVRVLVFSTPLAYKEYEQAPVGFGQVHSNGARARVRG